MGKSLTSPSFAFLNCKLRLRKPKLGNFPGGPLVKNPPSRAGNTGSIPDQGAKIQHAAWQLSPHAWTAEPLKTQHSKNSQPRPSSVSEMK